MSEQEIKLRRVLNATPEQVFRLWTQPESVRQWFGGLETEVRAVDVDLRPGGEFSIRVSTEQGPSTISGEFLEVEEPGRLVYTWNLASPQGTLPTTTVEVKFESRGDRTEVILRHGPFVDAEAKVLHSDGWQACFQGLEVLTRN